MKRGAFFCMAMAQLVKGACHQDDLKLLSEP